MPNAHSKIAPKQRFHLEIATKIKTIETAKGEAKKNTTSRLNNYINLGYISIFHQSTDRD